MGELVQFGHDFEQNEDLESNPAISGVPVDESEVESATPLGATPEIDGPAPLPEEPTPIIADPQVINKQLTDLLNDLYTIGRYLVSLPEKAIEINEKRALLEKYLDYEFQINAAKQRLIPASGDPTNAEIQQSVEPLRKNVQTLFATVQERAQAAGLRIYTRQAKNKAFIALGSCILITAAAGGIWWLYSKSKK